MFTQPVPEKSRREQEKRDDCIKTYESWQPTSHRQVQKDLHKHRRRTYLMYAYMYVYDSGCILVVCACVLCIELEYDDTSFFCVSSFNVNSSTRAYTGGRSAN